MTYNSYREQARLNRSLFLACLKIECSIALGNYASISEGFVLILSTRSSFQSLIVLPGQTPVNSYDSAVLSRSTNMAAMNAHTIVAGSKNLSAHSGS